MIQLFTDKWEQQADKHNRMKFSIFFIFGYKHLVMSRISTFFKSKDAKWYVEAAFVLLIIIAVTVIFVFAHRSLNDFWQSSQGAIGFLWIYFYRLLLQDYFDYKYLGKKLNIWAFLIFGTYLLVVPWFMDVLFIGLFLLNALIVTPYFRYKWRKHCTLKDMI